MDHPVCRVLQHFRVFHGNAEKDALNLDRHVKGERCDRIGLTQGNASAKQLARRYHELTGKPLGVTGEVAEYEAHRLLGVELATA